MRTTFAGLVLLFSALFFTACEKSDQLTLVSSTGRINHLLVVVDNEDWEGKVGEALLDIFGKPLAGLPQEEFQFSVTQVDPLTFSNLFRKNRNILFVGIDTLNHFYTNDNLYASPQKLLTILGTDETELIENIHQHEKEIVQIFRDSDLALYQKKVTEETLNAKEINTLNNLGIQMQIPKDYRMVEDTGEFMWFRNEITKGLLNLLAYEIPLGPDQDLATLDFVAIRDSIGKTYVPGQFENTYMTTEKKILPAVRKVKFAQRNAMEARGLWYVENDFMGGPFLSYTIYDQENHRLLVLEGFCYAPSAKKRDFLFELEAILKTASFD